MARKDKTEQKQTLSEFWTGEIESAEKDFERWVETSQRIVRRYRDDRDGVNSRARRFNILWSNVQVQKPALYGRMPKPTVTRRFKDSDPVGRAASTMLKRCLEYEVEEYPDFQRTMRCAVEDRLLPGRGVAWVRYEPHFVGVDIQNAEATQITTPKDTGTVTEDAPQQLDYECAPTDYVHWKDFLHEPARTWEEVTWVARRVFMTHGEGEKRFGKGFALVPLQTDDKKNKDSESLKGNDKKKKSEVWEIWDKTAKEVIWIAKNFPKELDRKDDPLGLTEFFPCPMPLFATVTTGSLIPVPDYCEYQDQAEELDVLTNRISNLTRACKVVGVYNTEFIELKRMLDEGVDNRMIGVTNWDAFSEKAGIKGSMQFMPLKEIIEALVQLYVARDSAKQIIYETIGISDILRGSTVASETLGAQELKAQFGSMRMKQSQEDVARFASDLLRMKAHIICKLFSDDTIMRMSGIDYTMDAQLAQQALGLLRQGTIKDFRIEVSADTLAQIDEARDKEERVEFLKATGAFLEKILPVVQSQPASAELLGEMLMFGVRGFRIGTEVEAAFERATAKIGEALKQPKPEPPEIMMTRIKEDAASKLAADDRNFELQKHNDDLAFQREKGQQIIEQRDRQAVLDRENELKKFGMQMQCQENIAAINAGKDERVSNEKIAKDERVDCMKIERDSEVSKQKIEADKKPMVQIDGTEQIGAVAEHVKSLADTQQMHMAEAMTKMGEGISAMSQVMAEFNKAAQLMAAPKEVVRDKNGRVAGMKTMMNTINP